MVPRKRTEAAEGDLMIGWRIFFPAADTYKTLNKGAHDTHAGPLRTLVSDARALTELIREKLA